MNKKNLKIGIVLNTAWNIYNYRLGLTQRLLEEGHQVFAIAPADDFVPQIEATGCKFIPVQHLSRKGTNPINDLKYSQELYQIYRSNELDVVLQYTIKPNIYGSIAAGRAGIKAICTVTGLGYSFLSDGLVNKIVKKLYKWGFRKADVVAFQNNDDKLLFEQLGLCPPSKTTLVKGSGIKTNYFKPLPKTQTNEKLIYLFVGRLLYDKGVRELLDAAEQILQEQDNIAFWIVGGIDDGNPSAIPRALVEDYHKKGIINYLGQSSDVRSIMQNADVVVLPSYREGLPRVMLESLAMAKPIITTDVPGCREVIKNGQNGYKVPVKNAQKLAEAICKMAKLSPEERQQMGLVGRQMALDEFDEQAIIKRYLDELAKLF